MPTRKAISSRPNRSRANSGSGAPTPDSVGSRTIAPKAASGRGRWSALPEPPTPVRSRHRERWSEQDERTVAAYYSTHGSAYVAALVGRTINAVRHRAEMLRVPGFLTRWWSEPEVQQAREKFKRARLAEVARSLGRTPAGVGKKLNQMGLKYGLPPRVWTTDELAYLGEWFNRLPIAKIAKRINRTPTAVRDRARMLGLRLRKPVPVWTRQADARLRAFKREGVGAREIARRMGRTRDDVADRARRLGLVATPRPWSVREDRLLRSKYTTRTYAELADEIGRSLPAVIARAVRLGIATSHARGQWSAHDDRRLVKLHGTMTNRELARVLGRSETAVVLRAGKLGCTAPSAPRWSPQEDRTLRTLHGVISHGKIAARMERSTEAIRKRAQTLGLTRDHPVHRRWTVEEDARLVKLARTLSSEEIARRLNRSVTAIKLRLRGLRLRGLHVVGGDTSAHTRGEHGRATK